MTDPETIIEFFTERAAIREHDGKQSRLMAETEAKREAMSRYGIGTKQVIEEFLRNEKR
jgi:hypothetical protein